MKKLTLLTLFSILSITVTAQSDLDALLAAGVDDAQRFANDYLAPGTNGLMHSMNANWFNTADAKPLGGFEISVIANASLINDENRSFSLIPANYQNIRFIDGATSKMVATALGENNPDVEVFVDYQATPSGPVLSERITLPSGIGSDTGNLLPTAFIQGALGLSKGIEIKARFVPKIKTDDIEINMYGAGLQVEFTKWLPADKVLPIAVSALVAYTHLGGSYDLTDTSGVEGENQRLENDTNTWLLQLIASTKLPVINFYGGLGYINGKSDTDLLGTYRNAPGSIIPINETDPFSVSSEVSAVRGTLGTKLKLGFFRINAEYHLSEFNAFSVGIHFGFR